MCDEHVRDEASGSRLTRRGFIATSACAVAAAGGLGALLGGCAREEAEEPRLTYNPSVVHPPPGGADQPSAAPPRNEVVTPPPRMRLLGRTGLKVSAVSMGAIGAVVDVLAEGLDRGINFIHCAMGYETLDRVAQAIEGSRDKVFLGLKYERASRVDWDYLNASLEALKADYVDILFFPLNSPQEARDRSHFDFFKQVKNQKKARFIGITTHSNVAPTIAAAVEAGFWDVLMPSYVPDRKTGAEVALVLDRAEKKRLGVVAMKTMAGIQPSALPQMQTRVKEVLADSSVSTLVKGILSFETLVAFLQAAATRLSKAESRNLDQHLASRYGQACSVCGDCPSCPRGVNVFEVMRDFDYYYSQGGRLDIARAMYRSLPASQRGSACDDCGDCAQKCLNGLDIARYVRAADLVLG